MKLQQKPPYYLSPRIFLAYYAVFALVMAGFFIRSNAAFWAVLPLVGSWEIGTHFSNFALSFAILAGACLPAVLMGKPARNFAVIAGLLVVANIVYELLLPVLNTRDPLDAAYGVVGTLFASAMLWLITKLRRPTR